MLRYLVLSSTVVVLFGCQASNPYQAQSRPLPPAPATAATHFDSSAYPAATEKKHYNYWCWSAPLSAAALSPDSAQTILAQQLEQYGLRAASATQQCQLKVQLSSQHSQRRRHADYNYPSAHYGYGYGRGHPFHDRYRYSGIGLEVPITSRSYTEHYQQLSLTFSDAQSGAVVWQAQGETTSNQQAQVSEEALRKTLNSMLNSYR